MLALGPLEDPLLAKVTWAGVLAEVRGVRDDKRRESRGRVTPRMSRYFALGSIGDRSDLAYWYICAEAV